MHTNREERSLAYQIITFIFVFVLIVFALSVLITRFLFSGIMLDNARELARHLSHETSYQIDGRLDKIQALASSIIELFRQDLMTEDEMDNYLYAIVMEHAEISSITHASIPSNSLYFKARIIYNDNNQTISKSVPKDEFIYSDWFQIPYLTQKKYWTEPWYDVNGPDKMVISFCLPQFREGKVVGVLRLDSELKYLQNLVSPLKIKKRGYAFLVSNAGTMITHPDDDLVMNETIFSIAEEHQDEQLRDLGRAMIHGEDLFFHLKGNSPFMDSWIYVSPLHSNKWSLGVLIAQADVLKELNLILIIQTFVSILSFLIISVIVYKRTVSVSKPLRKFTDIAEQIGKGDFDTQLPDKNRTYEIDRLSNAFASMQKSLKEYINNLQVTNEEKNRIVAEVRFASEIQKNLIPANTEHPYGLANLRVYGILEPASDIGGDLYDYFMIGDKHFCFAIADVVGKGIVASMTMTIVSTFLRSIGNYHNDASDIVSKLNNFLCRNNIEANFVTILLGVLNIDSGLLEFANAGHVPMFIRKIDRTVNKYGVTHSTAVGVFDEIAIGKEIVHLDDGDEIIIFTDGISEAMNNREEFLGIAGLEGIIKNLGVPNPENDAKTILSSVHSFSRKAVARDDITILAIEYKHPQKS